MADFATEDWIRETAERLDGAEADPALSLVLEQQVRDPDAAWHVTLADGAVSVASGPHGDPTLRLSSTHAVALAIHQGELSAQRAFLDGDLRIGGEINALIEHRAALSAIAALLKPPTSAT